MLKRKTYFYFHVFSLLAYSIIFYKRFQTKLQPANLFLSCSIILNQLGFWISLVELTLNLRLQHGGIETNPVPSKSFFLYFTFCDWNLSSLPSHNYAKVSLLQAFTAIHNFELICQSEVYLDSSIAIYEKSYNIVGYSMFFSSR